MTTIAEIDDSLISCGVSQLHSLFDLFTDEGIDERGEEITGDFVPKRLFDTCRYDHWSAKEGKQFIFSDRAHRMSPGSQLARFIRKNGYGKVTAGPVTVNPNTENKIRVWIWAPNSKFLDKVNS